MSTKDADPTALGAILLIMGTVTHEQLNAALRFQEQSQTRKPLGDQLVVLEFCTVDQVMVALAAQEKMRTDPHAHAVALVDIALARKRTVNTEQRRVQQVSERVVEKTTGTGHPAVPRRALVKTSKKD